MHMILRSFGNVPVNKRRQYVLAILLGLLRYNDIKNSEEKQTLFVS